MNIAILSRRGQGGGQPMAVVTTLALGALGGMMLGPASGSASSPVERPVAAIEPVRTTPKTARLPRASVIVSPKAVPEAAKAPSACMPPPAAPSRAGPIAYV